MQTAPRKPNPFVVLIATFALLPGLAAVLYYALDPGLRARMGWHAVWLFLWCGVCVFVLGRAVMRRWTTLSIPPHRKHGRTTPGDVAGPLSPF